MTTLREAARQALETLEAMNPYPASKEAQRANTISALRAALQVDDINVVDMEKPVAWQWLDTAYFGKQIPADVDPDEWRPLYAAPPQREPVLVDYICDTWEFITGHQIQFGPSSEGRAMFISTDEVVAFARAIEAAHGIKDET